MWCVPTSQARTTASSLEHPVCYQILIYLLYSCLLGFTWLNRGACLDLLKTLIHSISKPNFSCLSVPHRFIQIFITQKTLNLTPLSTTRLWDRLEWNCSRNQASSKNCILICAGKETYDFILGIKQRLTRGFCRAPSFPATLMLTLELSDLQIYWFLCTWHCLSRPQGKNKPISNTYLHLCKLCLMPIKMLQSN